MNKFLEQLPPDALEEVLANDPVIRNIGYRAFVSKSKGRRNGKQRVRRCWKEVELIRYQTGWHKPHRSRLDMVAAEVTRGLMDDDELYLYVRDWCGPAAGTQKPRGLL